MAKGYLLGQITISDKSQYRKYDSKIGAPAKDNGIAANRRAKIADRIGRPHVRNFETDSRGSILIMSSLRP